MPTLLTPIARTARRCVRDHAAALLAVALAVLLPLAQVGGLAHALLHLPAASATRAATTDHRAVSVPASDADPRVISAAGSTAASGAEHGASGDATPGTGAETADDDGAAAATHGSGTCTLCPVYAQLGAAANCFITPAAATDVASGLAAAAPARASAFTTAYWPRGPPHLT